MKDESEPPTDTRDGEFAESSSTEESSQGVSGFPLTFSGVASFASTGWARLFLWQAVVIATIAGSFMLLLGQHWSPVLDTAIAQLPEQGGLIEGRLQWSDTHTGTLAGNQFLRIIVDPKGEQQHGQIADFQIELRNESWVVGSILGYVEFPYAPKTFRIDRTKHIPWWGSRRPFLLIGISLSVGLIYGVMSLLLGFFGIWPAKAVAFFSDRQGRTGQLLRLGTAAWLPPGALMATASHCYALSLLPLMGLSIMIPLYFLVGWVYLFFSPLFLPRAVHSDENPFETEEEQEIVEEEEAPVRPDNPFV